MAYKIRYGFDRTRQNTLGRILRWQITGSGVLVLLIGLVILRNGGTRLLRGIFCAPPTSVAEQAVAAFADALCHGKGWYQGLAVWCRTIIDGGAI